MKYLIKLTIVLILGIVSVAIQSCNQSKDNNALFGFHFGQTSAEVDSIAIGKGFCKLVSANSINYAGSLDTLGVRWNEIEVTFENDSLCAVELSTRKDPSSSRFFPRDISDILYKHFHTVGSQIANNTLTEYGVWIYNDYLVSFLPNTEDIAILRIEPHSEYNAKRAKLKYIRYEIDENLKKLSESMVGYIEARESGQSEMRALHVDDARSANTFLDKNYEFMTTRQKELYEKLKDITY